MIKEQLESLISEIGAEYQVLNISNSLDGVLYPEYRELLNDLITVLEVVDAELIEHAIAREVETIGNYPVINTLTLKAAAARVTRLITVLDLIKGQEVSLNAQWIKEGLR